MLPIITIQVHKHEISSTDDKLSGQTTFSYIRVRAGEGGGQSPRQ